MVNFEVNYLAVLIVAVIHYFIGALWYSPLLFGKMWMQSLNITKDDLAKMKKGLWKLYLMAFIAALLISYVMALFIVNLQATTFYKGAMIGVWLWLGFILPVAINNVLWAGESIKIYCINVSYKLVTHLLMGGLLAVM